MWKPATLDQSIPWYATRDLRNSSWLGAAAKTTLALGATACLAAMAWATPSAAVLPILARSSWTITRRESTVNSTTGRASDAVMGGSRPGPGGPGRRPDGPPPTRSDKTSLPAPPPQGWASAGRESGRGACHPEALLRGRGLELLAELLTLGQV